MHVDVLVIGAGLSGLAAATRLARYNDKVLLLEKHSRVGGLNSYYYRNHRLFETGLHAITNYADKADKKAPLNRLLRQLKIRREEIGLHQQIRSEIRFTNRCSLTFSNDFNELREEIETKFPHESAAFSRLLTRLDSINPFETTPFQSARRLLASYLEDPLLIDMLLCPLLFYGSSRENDIDVNQFVIMFRSLFQEGMFRPAGTIKDLLDLIVARFESLGGTIRLNSGVREIVSKDRRIVAVRLEDGSEIDCDHLVSTVGLDETRTLLGEPALPQAGVRLGFVETIFQLGGEARTFLPADRTCIFFSTGDRFDFKRPAEAVDFSSGVICLPFNFKDRTPADEFIEVRTTHLANYTAWNMIAADKADYAGLKGACERRSLICAESIIGPFAGSMVYHDSFTPLTIERFTGKKEGAIYGSPAKVKDGRIGYDNLVLAGTDQGFLGIVGSMLSGVSMVNQHILPRL